MVERQIREAEFIRQHTLSPEQLKKLLEDKIVRARQYQTASLVKQEVLKSAA